MSALRANRPPTPRLSTSTPATAGPTARARFTAMELKQGGLTQFDARHEVGHIGLEGGQLRGRTAAQQEGEHQQQRRRRVLNPSTPGVPRTASRSLISEFVSASPTATDHGQSRMIVHCGL